MEVVGLIRDLLCTFLHIILLKYFSCIYNYLICLELVLQNKNI